MTMILMLLAISCGQSFQQDSKEKRVVTSTSLTSNENEKTAVNLRAYLIIPKGEKAACLARFDNIAESDLPGLDSMSNTSHLNPASFITSYAVSRSALEELMGISNDGNKEVAEAMLATSMVGAGAVATTQTGGSGGSSSYGDDDEGTWRYRSNRSDRSYYPYSNSSSNNYFFYSSTSNSRRRNYSLDDLFSERRVTGTTKQPQKIEATKLSPVQMLVNLQDERDELLQQLEYVQVLMPSIGNLYASTEAMEVLHNVMSKLHGNAIPIIDGLDPEEIRNFKDFKDFRGLLDYILKQQSHDSINNFDAKLAVEAYIPYLRGIINDKYNGQIQYFKNNKVHSNLPKLIRKGSVPLAESYVRRPVITAIAIGATGFAATVAFYHVVKWVGSLIKHKDPKATGPALSLTEQEQGKNQETKVQYMSLSPHIEEDTMRSLILALPPVEPQIPCF